MPEAAELEIKARVEEILNRHAAVGLAVGVVRNGSLEFFYGHGAADIASNTPVTEDTVFRVASITKTFTAIAVMQLQEQGRIDLDAPASDYLRAYTLIPAKAAHPPATVRHLLTHTAGLPELVYLWRAFKPVLGETVAYGQRVPTLAEFYRGRLRLVAEPGTRHTYSNHGFATLGQIVEDVSGQPLARYFRDRIFAPLGMADTDLIRSDHVEARLATGYALRAGGPRPVSDCDVVTVGGGAIYSTTRDMTRYVAALLGGGANEHGSVLKAETLATMFAPQYQPDPRLLGVGLAFFRHDIGGHLVVEHDGLMPGFSSQMSVAPDDGVGVVAFTNGARSAKAWLGAEVAGILRYVLGVPDPVIRTDVPHHPEIWSDICGWYSFRGSPCDVQKWFIAGAGVFVRHGRLMLRALTPMPALSRGLLLHPDDVKDPYVFRIDLSSFGIGTSSPSGVICVMRGFGRCFLRSSVPPLEEPSMRKQHVVVLSELERARLHTLIGQGSAPARALTHARILLKVNQGEAGPGWTDRAIATALEIHHTTVARVRQQYAAGGLDAAVDRKAPEREYRRKLDGEQEAHLVALACSAPPEGRKRWTLRLLAQRLVQLEVVDAVSYETVRQALKQTASSRG